VALGRDGCKVAPRRCLRDTEAPADRGERQEPLGADQAAQPFPPLLYDMQGDAHGINFNGVLYDWIRSLSFYMIDNNH
jgi:hypothetical protein